MIRNWIKELIREALDRDFETIAYKLHNIDGDIENVISSLDGCLSREQEHFESNIKKLNEMACELKGVISISRATLNPKKNSNASKST